MSVAPGATIGIIGGGQLGRMLSLAAAQLGYRTHVLAPDDSPCGADVAAAYTRAAYDDRDALARFAGQVDVVTYEFENLPVAALEALGPKLRPGTASLASAQDRAIEKRFLEGIGARVARWQAIGSEADLDRAVSALSLPFVIKSRTLGYDGKGQAWVRDAAEVHDAWDYIGRNPAVAEAAVDFSAEFSVILARGADGQTRSWEVPRNIHDGGILRRSEVPFDGPEQDQFDRALAQAERIAHELGHIGVITVEYFATADGPLVNEIAPRVHNSGHWTIEGSKTSQFEQHIRAICGLPLGAVGLTGRSAAMDNLIGNHADRWAELLAEPGAHLHLYGKGEARPGRKMGHVTRVAR